MSLSKYPPAKPGPFTIAGRSKGPLFRNRESRARHSTSGPPIYTFRAAVRRRPNIYARTTSMPTAASVDVKLLLRVLIEGCDLTAPASRDHPYRGIRLSRGDCKKMGHMRFHHIQTFVRYLAVFAHSITSSSVANLRQS